MILPIYDMFGPVCDGCSRHLGAEKTVEAAEAVMRSEGWQKAEGKDLCPLCWGRYQTTGELPRRYTFRKEITMKDLAQIKKVNEVRDKIISDLEGSPPEPEAEEMDWNDTIGRDDPPEERTFCPSGDTGETGAWGPPVATTLAQDMIHAVSKEVRRRAETTYHSAFESFAILSAELEVKAAVEKDLKKAKEELWDGVKAGDDDVVSAYLQNIARVARESAMAWVRVAAIAEKAGDEL